MRKFIALTVLLASLSACSVVSSQYSLGARAEMNQQYDDAIAYYEKATLEDPRDAVYRAALQRAKIRASLSYIRTARALAEEGKKEEALAAYAKAQSYNPRDPAIAREARLLTTPQDKPAEAKPERIEFPIKLKTKDEPLQLKFPVETSIRSIFQALGKASGISVDLRREFPRHPLPDRSEQHDVRAGPPLALHGQQELLPDHRRADGPRHPRQRDEAAAVRGQLHPDVLSRRTSPPRMSRPP